MTNRILSIFASFLILLSITIVPAVAAPSGNEKVAVIIGFKDKPDAALMQQNINPFQIFENDFITTSGDEYVPGEFIVKFKTDIGKNKIAEINLKHGTSIKHAGQHFMKLNVPQGRTVSQMVESYSKNPNVEYAEANYIAHTHMVPDDAYYGYQWHLDNAEYGGINMENAWNHSTGSDVIVAVIDTGVAYEDYEEYAQATDLANTDFVQGYDFVNNDNHPNDDAGHGTHVTGTIAQSTNNSIGVAGVAFDCTIMPIKVLDNTGSGTYIWIADGIRYAADEGAQVISMSLGGTSPSETLEYALEYAYDKGVTIVCSAGNDGARANKPSYPAAYDEYCIAVGATRYDETVSYYSTTGDYVDIAAPGGDMRKDQNYDGKRDGVLQQTHNGVDYKNFGYWFYQGTSMAAPHVSGVAALLISNGVTNPDNVREAMQSTAEDKGPDGWDSGYGWGIVDAYAALQSVTPNSPPEAYDQSALTDEDTSISIILNATDPEDDPLTYSIVSGPLNGTLIDTALDVTYTPDADYNGADSFTFKANDGKADSNIATVSITVDPVNDSPAANDQLVTTTQNTSVNITLTASDVDDDPLNYSIVSGPFNGTLTGTAPDVTYTSDADYNGPDSFTFKANDGNADSNNATVSITVTAENNPPVANANGPYTGTEGVAVIFNGSGSFDPDDDPLTYIWDFGDGNNGTGMSPTHIYDANGTYTVTLIVNDGKANSDPDTANVTISDVDPVASFTSDSPKPEGVAMTFADTSTSYDGITSWSWDFGDGETSSNQNSTHAYTSAGNYTVDLTVTEADGDTATSTAQVTVTVTEAYTMQIASIEISTIRTRSRGWYTYATATVMLVNTTGSPVAGANVSGQWSGLTNDLDFGTTDDNGQIALNSNLVKSAAGMFTFTVDNVMLDGWTYNASANVESSDSITV